MTPPGCRARWRPCRPAAARSRQGRRVRPAQARSPCWRPPVSEPDPYAGEGVRSASTHRRGTRRAAAGTGAPGGPMATALVTGAAGGIGLATVQALADAGWQVIATVRNPKTCDDLRAV